MTRRLKPRRKGLSPAWPATSLAIALAGCQGVAGSPGPGLATWGIDRLPELARPTEAPRAAGPNLGASGPGDAAQGPALEGQPLAPASPGPAVAGGGGGGGGAAPGQPEGPPPTNDPGPSPSSGGPLLFTAPGEGPRQGKLVGPQGQALAGVLLQSGTHQVSSDAQGNFLLPPPSASAEAVVALSDDFRPAMRFGWFSGSLTWVLHPQSPPSANALGEEGGVLAFEVHGRVVDAQGQSVSGATVVAQSVEGPSASARTEADGSYRLGLSGFASGRSEGAVVWAYEVASDGQVERLGALTGQVLEAGRLMADLPLQSPSGQVSVVAASYPFPASLDWTLKAVAPGLPGVPLAVAGRRLVPPHSFQVPGVSLELEAQAVGLDGARSAHWVGPAPGGTGEVQVPWSQSPTAIGQLEAQAGATWRWRTVPGASAYRLAYQADAGGPLWEVHTLRPELVWPATGPTGPGQVEILAGPSEAALALRAFPQGRQAEGAWSRWRGRAR